jgi:hypothetical protein
MEIPIKEAKRIAKLYGWDEVILIGQTGNKQHVTTFGKTIGDCFRAAMNGNLIKRNLFGWPEAECQAKPRRLGGKGK